MATSRLFACCHPALPPDVAEAGAPEAALALLDGLDAQLRSHHLLPAVRAELLARVGRRQEAAAAFTDAVQFARTGAEKNHLMRRLGQFD